MAEVQNLITGPLARVLEADRSRFNALFAQARHHMPSLDGAAFANHLRTTVAPIVAAVAREAPAQVGAVVDVLYEFSLELLSKDLLARYPALAEGWSKLLAGLPRHLAAAPRRFAGSVTNALYNLAQVPEARPQEWIACLLQLGTLCSDVPALLEAGKVCAWRAGLALLRSSALETAPRLDPPLARAALGLNPAADSVGLDSVVSQLAADPWLHPATVGKSPPPLRRLRLVRTVGAFRGFGGLFLRPPQVAFVDGHFRVADGDRSWFLTADRFGATLHPTETILASDKSDGPFRIDRKGKVTRRPDSQVFPELQNATSHATDATTLAVTVPLSHQVYLVALVEEEP